METIRKTASFIISGIEETIQEKTCIKDRLAAGEAKKEESLYGTKSNKGKAIQYTVLA